MDREKILLLIDSLEANLKLLRLEINEQQEIEEKSNTTISLRELLGKIEEEPYEPDYMEEP